jgi:hypothetical protein
MREIRPSGSEGGGTERNRSSLPLSITASLRDASASWQDPNIVDRFPETAIFPTTFQLLTHF